jgi:hypothetical protein
MFPVHLQCLELDWKSHQACLAAASRVLIDALINSLPMSKQEFLAGSRDHLGSRKHEYALWSRVMEVKAVDIIIFIIVQKIMS